ncbi:MAG: hypothetical protein O3A90_09860 [Proteobacteria bacterium]|jgi:hypothetical protein|nr:hypothetical protein [Pseudomonadota bacterium]MDA0851331.1 hypothetical protein [Pseudomonadota bacterium]
MSDVLATLALSVVFGIAATIGFYFVGELSSAQSIFLGFLVTAVLAPLLNWILFRPLPKIHNGQLQKDE